MSENERKAGLCRDALVGLCATAILPAQLQGLLRSYFLAFLCTPVLCFVWATLDSPQLAFFSVIAE